MRTGAEQGGWGCLQAAGWEYPYLAELLCACFIFQLFHIFVDTSDQVLVRVAKIMAEAGKSCQQVLPKIGSADLSSGRLRPRANAIIASSSTT